MSPTLAHVLLTTHVVPRDFQYGRHKNPIRYAGPLENIVNGGVVTDVNQRKNTDIIFCLLYVELI